jgi:hypothetical protein
LRKNDTRDEVNRASNIEVLGGIVVAEVFFIVFVRVNVDLAQIRHTPQSPSGRQPGNIALLATKTEALKAEIAGLEARTADHRAGFECQRERADRLAVELLQVTAETMAAKELTARLEGEVAALRMGGRTGGSIDSQGQAERRLGHLAAIIVEADRKACSPAGATVSQK